MQSARAVITEELGFVPSRTSDGLLHELIDTLNVVAFRADLDDRLTYLSPAWTAITGLSVAESLGRRLTSIVIEEDRPDVIARLAPLLTGQVSQARHEARHRSGAEIRWMSIRTAVSRDESGRAIGFRGVIADATEQVEKARETAESEALYRLLADHSNDMIVRIGLDGLRRYVSPASRALLGYEPEELVGETPAGAIHADDRARTIEVCTSLLAGAVDPMCVYRQARKDGSWAWLEATYRLVRDPRTGQPDEFIASVRDVSRREAAELTAREAAARVHEASRMLAMAESVAHVGHWRMDLASGHLFWSAEVFRIHGHSEGDPPDLQGALDAYHPDDRPAVEAAVARCSADGGEFQFTARIIRPTGEVRHVASRGQAERGPDGAILGLFGVFQDVTDQTLAEQALKAGERRYRELAETDELTGLASRRLFLAELADAAREAEATGAPLSVAIFDVDHFKRVNDGHGHAIGDSVLRAVSLAAGRVIRDSDLVGRLGGEEFGVLMRGADLGTASRIAEILRQEVEACRPTELGAGGVTISIGLYERRAEISAQPLLAAADAALYEAKRRGRNRVYVAAKDSEAA